jgi:hypothetical protein
MRAVNEGGCGGGTGVNVRVAVRVPFRVPVIVTGVDAVTALVAMLNVADVAFAFTVAAGGTVAEGLLLDSETLVADVGARSTVTVP